MRRPIEKFFSKSAPQAVQQVGTAAAAVSPPCSVAAFVMGTAAAAVDLRTIAPQTWNMNDAGAAQVPYNTSLQTQGPVSQFIRIFADTGNLGVVFGPSLASVTGTMAPALAGVGTCSSTTGAYTGTTTTCWEILAGTSDVFMLRENYDLFMGYIGSAVGKVRIYQANPPGE